MMAEVTCSIETGVNMRATVAETNTTWEHGKLKLTLTRKSVSEGGRSKTEDHVTVINKDGTTRNQDSGGGFMWSGTVQEFKEFAGSLTSIYAAVDQARSAGEGCTCPTKHTIDCGK